jgi:hypothetical protein
MSTYVYTKDPNATLDYIINWLDWLGSDTIATSTWVVPTGLSEVSDAFASTYTTIWLAGGNAESNYTVTNEVVSAGGRTDRRYLTILVKESSNLSYLIPYVRLRLGDTDVSSRRYLDEWLQRSLVLSTITLGKWMNFKYLLDENYNIYRNPNHQFMFPAPPVIEGADESIIVAMATYLTLEGSLENSAWDVVSWKDAEISFSNLESARTRSRVLERLWEEITLTVQPPGKRLSFSVKGHLPGYKRNVYEFD